MRPSKPPGCGSRAARTREAVSAPAPVAAGTRGRRWTPRQLRGTAPASSGTGRGGQLALSHHRARRDHRWVRQQLRDIRLDPIRGQAVRIRLVGLILEDAGREHDALLRVVHKVIGDEAPMLADQRNETRGDGRFESGRGSPARSHGNRAKQMRLGPNLLCEPYSFSPAASRASWRS
jgi:hypothetical protein